ncbi:MAG: phosphotransferase [Chloroflexi bacterium]|nr:phosphotransferase [Chloroflexota bacterium]
MVTQPVASLYPEVDFPEDPGLGELPKLFDPNWIWETFCQRFEGPDTDPDRFRIRQFSHTLGRSAIISYEVEWDPEDYLPSQHFTVSIHRDKPIEVFQFPDDPLLPGLKEASDPETALRLLNRHVLPVGARRARVEVIRYRYGSRAVLRHSVSRARFYARVMRSDATAPLLAAREPIGRSSFVLPRLAGYWSEGSVMWMPEMPGKNLRRHIRRGNMPDPAPLLDGLETLWAQSATPDVGQPFDLATAYGRAKRAIRHKVHCGETAFQSLDEATRTLDPFVKAWQPIALAHNDFYDDQLLVLPDGRMAVVDFEETGPGDPLLDVGNFLAHLRWRSCLGRQRDNDASAAYHDLLRHAALRQFGWNPGELAQREAVCLFRICTNIIRHPQSDWRDKLEAGLALVNETLG